MNNKFGWMFILFFFVFNLSLKADQVLTARGISMNIPDNWMILSKGQTRSLPDEIRQRFPQMRNIDFNKLETSAYDTSCEGFLENVNIVMVRGQMPLSNDAITQVADALEKQYADLGMNPSIVSSKISSVGKNDAAVVHCEIDSHYSNGRIQQLLAMMPADRETYIITFSFPENNSEVYLAGINQILSSVKLEHPADSSGRISPLVMNIIKYTLLGAILGAAVGLAQYLKNRKKRITDEPPASK
jgi:hypothetical protein